MKQTITAIGVAALVASALLANPVFADQNKLGNSKLKELDYSRLEGKNRFKVGCDHIIRGANRDQVWHPTYLSNEEIGLAYRGKWVTVASSDKTRLLGANQEVTVWRSCKRL